ncbi:CHAT domain-containing protein [Ephemerocybe angulata]|uniref:CHAT domain-containing protein n=1 Tax=Ephemerocybe angulata TaxID=980116 RepID=A0A8H6HBE1_9AGAR|nr:CHAT domain-containing protein [Tulosesus angulatus]
MEQESSFSAQLNNCGIERLRTFQQTGDLSELAEGISTLRQAVNLTPHGHADLPSCLNNLGASFQARYERTGELSDILYAIAVQQKSVDLTPHGHADLPSHLNNLGYSLARRFERIGELSDIADAISAQQKAVDLTPHDHAHLPAWLNNLAMVPTCEIVSPTSESLSSVAINRTGELSDIASSISMLQKALDLTPHGHPYLPMLLNNLGSSFECRYERTNELSDIADAISVQGKGVDLIPDGHAELPTLLNNLGNSFRCRFERTGDLSDIANAISALQRAVDLTPHGHTGLPGRFNNLGTCLARRFQRTGELSDIGDAISAHQKAVDLTPHGHTDLAGLLNNLGTSFQSRYERTGELSAIARKQLISLRTAMPPTLLNSSTSQTHSTSRAISNRNTGDLETCLSHYKAAAISVVGPPQDKLEAATRRARALIKHFPQSPDIITSFETALGQVALIAGLEQTSGLNKAVASSGPSRTTSVLRLTTYEVTTRISHRISRMSSKQLEDAGSSRSQSNVDMPMSEKISLENEARAHLGLARKWEDLLKTARAIPGFESFLKPLSCSSLMRGVPESSIVVINIADRRCDALALLPGLDKPLHIPLPAFSIKKASEYRNVLASQLREHHLRAREEQENLLRDVQFSARGVRPAPIGRDGENAPVCWVLLNLWYEVVKPILDGLGFQHMHQTGGQLPPRLWWCPTGPLSFLPLHAAGIYRGSNRESVSDYVVSSYTPTVTAVTERAKNRLSVDAKASGLFLTSQPNVPGASPIPGTTSEVRAILKRAEESGVRAMKCEGEELTVGACLMRMQDYSSIHLACHGSQNATEPLRSRFLFHRGSLELGRIIQSDLKNADLAFLSACQTSTGEEKLSDEAIHLTAGMLAAGYRRVIGTMWSIGDKPAQEVAISFYDYLLTPLNGARNGGFDGALSAFALDHATRRLRLSLDDSEHSLLTWIPFVHFGC